MGTVNWTKSIIYIIDLDLPASSVRKKTQIDRKQKGPSQFIRIKIILAQLAKFM